MPKRFTDSARTTLASGISNVATTLVLAAGKGALFPNADTGAVAVSPAADWFKIVLTDSIVTEIAYVRTRTGDSLSDVLRGREGTTALNLSAGAVVGLRVTSVDLESYELQADFGARKNTSNEFTKNQSVVPVQLTSAATVIVDADLSNNFRLNLAQNVVLANPTNLKNGSVLNFVFRQDNAGSRTLTFGAMYRFSGGVDPVLSTAPFSTDFMSCYNDENTSSLLCSLSKGFA